MGFVSTMIRLFPHKTQKHWWHIPFVARGGVGEHGWHARFLGCTYSFNDNTHYGYSRDHLLNLFQLAQVGFQDTDHGRLKAAQPGLWWIFAHYRLERRWVVPKRFSRRGRT